MKPVVAAFDFDGTLTYRDSLLPFLIFKEGVFKTAIKLFKVLPKLLLYTVGIVSRQEAKEAVLTEFLFGESISSIRHAGKHFAETGLNKLLRPDAMECLRWHQAKGHTCVLVSASLDIYLRPWAEQNGFKHLICSRLEVDQGETVTGKLKGLNCWGPEKLRRLEALLGPKGNYRLYAYGDSRGDQEMLAAADFPSQRCIIGDKEGK